MANIIPNTGNCDDINDADSDIKLAARYKGSAVHNYGAVFSHSLYTVGGRLFWGIDFFPNVTRVELAEALANRIVKRMAYLFDPQTHVLKQQFGTLCLNKSKRRQILTECAKSWYE